MIVGVAGFLGAGYWLLLAGSNDARDAIIVVDSDDLYVVNDLELAADAPREDRVLRDVAVAGFTYVVDGDEVVFHNTFGYDHEGDPLFGYSVDGDDEWTLAVLDGREVIDIAQFDGRPSPIHVTPSGTYVIEQRASSCSIVEIDGRDTSRIARSDYCLINPVADVGVLAERRRSRIEVSYVALGSEEETPALDVAEDATLGVSFSPTNRTMLVSSSSFDDSESVLIDLETGEIIAEEDLFGDAAIDGGFIAYENPADDPVLVFVGADGVQELAVGNAAAVFNRSGSSIAVQEFDDDGDVILSVADVEGDAIGPLAEIEVFNGVVDLQALPDDRWLVVDDDGLVATIESSGMTEIGDLRPGSDFTTPQIRMAGDAAMLVSVGEAVGLVRTSDAGFVELDDLEGTASGAPSPDGRWLAVTGSESQDRPGQTLLLVDLRSLEWSIVDDDDGFGSVQFSDGFLYFEVFDNESEIRRVRLGLDERVEDVVEGDIQLYVPTEGFRLPARSWDVPFLTVE